MKAKNNFPSLSATGTVSFLSNLFQNFQLKIESIKNHAFVAANYTWPQYIWRSHGYQVNPLHTRRSVLAKYNINNPVCL